VAQQQTAATLISPRPINSAGTMNENQIETSSEGVDLAANDPGATGTDYVYQIVAMNLASEARSFESLLRHCQVADNVASRHPYSQSKNLKKALVPPATDIVKRDSPMASETPNVRVIGIGASAGGIEALREFFDAWGRARYITILSWRGSKPKIRP
jgi:chemotaxis response regulator CheB